jgi:hypothetical protein
MKAINVEPRNACSSRHIEMKKTKRIIFICLLSIITLSASYGQAGLLVLILGDKVATENFYLSIDGALNISTLPGLAEYKTIVGVNYGLGVHIKLGEKWFLKPEFKPLSRKGATKVNPITSVSGDITLDETKIKMNYIDFPLLVQYNVTPKLFISAGPQISFVTDANQYVYGTQQDGLETTVKVTTKSFFNKTNFSFPVEAGYCFTLTNKKSTSKLNVNVFARYEYGFLEIFKDPAVGSANISLFQIGLSLPFIKSGEKQDKTEK